MLLPPQVRAIVDQIEKAIQKADSAANKRSESANEQQANIANAIKGFSDRLEAYEKKQDSNESKKESRETKTLYSLWAAAGVSLILAVLSACQLEEMRKAYGPLKQSAEAAEKQATAGRAYLFVQPASGQFGGFDPKGQFATGTYRPSVSFLIKNFGPTPAIITKIETHLYLNDGSSPTSIVPVPNSPEAKVTGEATAWNIDPVDKVGSAFPSIDTSNPSTRVMIAGNADSGPLQQTFVFNRGVHTTHWAWFYCAITYKDIFGGKDRHTFLYIQLVGSGFTYPPNSEHNSWD